MTTLTVSSKYQIVIPARMRESLGIRAGLIKGGRQTRSISL